MPVQASAPGKVLILGGYLIVQSPNVGISIGVTSRFTTRVLSATAVGGAPPIGGPEPTEKRHDTTVNVASPQFKTQFTFVCTTCTKLDGSGDGEVTARQTAGPESPFLYYAILYAIAAARLARESDGDASTINIELLADNDFYSQRNHLESEGKAVNVENLRGLPKHLPLVGSVSKTGLGSSAAMTTSVVSCLYAFLVGDVNVDQELMHRISQVAHSVAQGKIGSGFDVYTGVYGTCAYRRFPARNAEMMMTGDDKPTSVSLHTLRACLDMSVEWVKRVPFHLPHGVKLVLGDVHQGGSSTPGMVAKIMAWQKSVASEPDNLWEKLRNSNEVYLQGLRDLIALSEAEPTAYAGALAALANAHITAPNDATPPHSPANAVEARFLEVAQAAKQSRTLLKAVGEASQVTVEPDELTGLLNDTAALPGVFAAGCPGAGGYDAVFALAIGDEACARVEAYWESYAKMNVCPLLVREDPSGLVVEPFQQ